MSTIEQQVGDNIMFNVIMTSKSVTDQIVGEIAEANAEFSEAMDESFDSL